MEVSGTATLQLIAVTNKLYKNDSKLQYDPAISYKTTLALSRTEVKSAQPHRINKFHTISHSCHHTLF
jgi:hypothetical protein